MAQLYSPVANQTSNISFPVFITNGTASANTITANTISRTIVSTHYVTGTNNLLPSLPPVLFNDIDLPDGAKIIFDHAKGTYRIEDKDAKVLYRGKHDLAFNRYINASDLLEEFVDEIKELGKINKQEFLNLPIELFIKWLVIKAAEADGEEILPEEKQLTLPAPVVLKKNNRCKCCGRFIHKKKAAKNLFFCNSDHYSKYEERI